MRFPIYPFVISFCHAILDLCATSKKQLLIILVGGSHQSFFNFVGLVLVFAHSKCFGDGYIDVREQCVLFVGVAKGRNCGRSFHVKEMQQLLNFRHTIEMRFMETRFG